MTPTIDRRQAERRVPDQTQEWLAEKDRRHAERRQFAERPEPTGFGALSEIDKTRSMKYDAYTARKVHAALVDAEKAALDHAEEGAIEKRLWFQLMDARIDHEIYAMKQLEEVA